MDKTEPITKKKLKEIGFEEVRPNLFVKKITGTGARIVYSITGHSLQFFWETKTNDFSATIRKVGGMEVMLYWIKTATIWYNTAS